MQIVRRRNALSIALALTLPLAATGLPTPAAAFQAGPSPDFAGCIIWFNDQGKPLRNKIGREIARETPCHGRAGHQDAFQVLPGEARNTLVIKDETHQLECVLVLAAGSTTVVVPQGCKPLSR